MPKEDGDFYVGIKDPLEIRRETLESAKRIIGVLKRYETFKEIREEKTELMLKLEKDVKELTFLINKLKAAMPKADVLVEAKPRIQQNTQTTQVIESGKKDAKKQPIKTASKARPKTDLERLENELNDIENKLGLL